MRKKEPSAFTFQSEAGDVALWGGACSHNLLHKMLQSFPEYINVIASMCLGLLALDTRCKKHIRVHFSQDTNHCNGLCCYSMSKIIFIKIPICVLMCE